MNRQTRDLDEQPFELGVVLIRRNRVLACFQIFDLLLELGAALHQHRESGISRQRHRRFRFEIGDLRDRAVGSRRLRFATDAGARIVEQWTLANYVSDLPSFPTPPELQYVKWQFRTAFPTLRTACNNTKLPAQFPLAPQSVTGSSAQLAGMLRAGSGSYYVMQQAPSTPGFTLLFSTSSGTALRTSLVPQLAVLRLQ